jgi:choline dehydrogenase-like flavoprotein
MIVDYQDGTLPHDFEADLCIVGAGAAGLAIAHAFVGSGIRVCVLESGGLAGEEASQALYAGESIGDTAFDAGSSRMRAFGGSCNLWGGGCITLGRQDMAVRDWVPHSGWPLTYDELAPWYARARAFCGIDAHAFTDGSFSGPLARPALAFEDGALVNQIFARSPVVFGEAYRDAVRDAPNVTVVLHANLLALEAAPCGTVVTRAAIGSLDGRRGHVRARHFVLAAGGIENARLLLLSDAVVADGLGNGHGQVGRYFMDHPSGTLGSVVTDAPDRITRPYDRSLGKGPAPTFPEIGLAAATQATLGTLSGRVHPFVTEGEVPRGLRALRDFRAALRKPVTDEGSLLAARLCDAMRNGPAPGGALAVGQGLPMLALRLGLGLGDIARAFVHKLADRPTVQSNRVELVGYFEQAPNPDSRICLGRHTDALGLRALVVDWRLTALDHHTYRAAARLFGAQLARACDGRFEPAAWVDDETTAPAVHGTAHHLGTTRMADDARAGVVDRDCRVHGVHNLHVAGSSVFPTGGWAFPTFTIIALSLRLAEHLRIALAACNSAAVL